jgi:hypothetical protein
MVKYWLRTLRRWAAFRAAKDLLIGTIAGAVTMISAPC